MNHVSFYALLMGGVAVFCFVAFFAVRGKPEDATAPTEEGTVTPFQYIVFVVGLLALGLSVREVAWDVHESRTENQSAVETVQIDR